MEGRDGVSGYRLGIGKAFKHQESRFMNLNNNKTSYYVSFISACIFVCHEQCIALSGFTMH